MKTLREKFEIFAVESGFDITRNKKCHDDYEEYDTHCAWLGFKAAKEDNEL
jgi:hypothetical protein